MDEGGGGYVLGQKYKRSVGLSCPFRHLAMSMLVNLLFKKKVGIQLQTAFFGLYTAHIPKFLYSTLYTVILILNYFNDFCIPANNYFCIPAIY